MAGKERSSQRKQIYKRVSRAHSLRIPQRHIKPFQHTHKRHHPIVPTPSNAPKPESQISTFISIFIYIPNTHPSQCNSQAPYSQPSALSSHCLPRAWLVLPCQTQRLQSARSQLSSVVWSLAVVRASITKIAPVTCRAQSRNAFYPCARKCSYLFRLLPAHIFFFSANASQPYIELTDWLDLLVEIACPIRLVLGAWLPISVARGKAPQSLTVCARTIQDASKILLAVQQHNVGTNYCMGVVLVFGFGLGFEIACFSCTGFIYIGWAGYRDWYDPLFVVLVLYKALVIPCTITTS